MSLSGEFSVAGANNSIVLQSLDEQRSEKKLCDVVLRIGDETFPAHRCVLAASSIYFRSMFEEYNFVESRNKEIELHSITIRALRAIMDMVYTGTLKIDIDIMHDVMAGGDHLLMVEVKYASAEFMLMVLKSDIAASEALRIRRSADLYSLTDLQHEADSVISLSFREVAKSPAFNELTPTELLSLLTSDFVQEGDERVFWEAARSWVYHDLQNRCEFIEEVLQGVRFPLIDAAFLLSSIQKDEMLAKSESGQKMILEAMRYQLMPQAQSSMQSAQSKPRFTSRDIVVFCLAGVDSFKCYVPRYNRWYSLTAPHPMSLSNKMETGEGSRTFEQSLINAGGTVYACTQATRPEEVGNFEMVRLQQYSMERNDWRDCSLPSKVGVPTFLIECNNSMYACSRNAIERYHAEQNSWEVISISRLSPCQFAVSDENKILLYTLEDGISQEINMDKPNMITTRQVMSPNRFITEVVGACKLPNHEVFLSLRTISGINRKIFNVKTNLWRDAHIYHHPNRAPMQPRPGDHYPPCFDLSELWQCLCDRTNNVLYFLSTKSGMVSLPQDKSSPPPPSQLDGVLPFYRVDLNKSAKTWNRLASLPEHLCSFNLQMCICDGQSSMGSASVL